MSKLPTHDLAVKQMHLCESCNAQLIKTSGGYLIANSKNHNSRLNEAKTRCP